MWNQTNVNAKLTTHFHKVQTKTNKRKINLKFSYAASNPTTNKLNKKRPNWTVVWSFQK